MVFHWGFHHNTDKIKNTHGNCPLTGIDPSAIDIVFAWSDHGLPI